MLAIDLLFFIVADTIVQVDFINNLLFVFNRRKGHANEMYGRLVTQDQLVAFAANSAGQSVVANEFVSIQQKSKFAPVKFRDPTTAPLRKLSVDLIKTYKHINEVRNL